VFSAPVAPVRLTWNDGTLLPAFHSATCRPATTEELDDSLGAVLGASAGEGGLVFSLPVGTVEHVRPVRVSASAVLDACNGTLAVQRNNGSGWVDVSTTGVAPRGATGYGLSAAVEPGNDVRLVLRASGTCTVFDGEITSEFCAPDTSNGGCL
jgi:hypothetical protein